MFFEGRGLVLVKHGGVDGKGGVGVVPWGCQLLGGESGFFVFCLFKIK